MEIKDMVVEWVVEKLQDVADFFTMIFDKVMEGIQKLVDFLKFLFNWNDILQFKDGLVTQTNAQFDHLFAMADVAEDKMEKAFDKVKHKLANIIYPDELKKKVGDKSNPQSSIDHRDEMDDDTKASMAYSEYQASSSIQLHPFFLANYGCLTYFNKNRVVMAVAKLRQYQRSESRLKPQRLDLGK